MVITEEKQFPITFVSRLIGLPLSTIRTWERRYKILAPSRSKSGARLYSHSDIDQLKHVYELVRQGMKIGELAERVRRGDPLPALELVSSILNFSTQRLIEQFYRDFCTLKTAEARRSHDLLRIALEMPLLIEYVYDALLQRLWSDCGSGRMNFGTAGFFSTFVKRQLTSFLNLTDLPVQFAGFEAILCTPPGEFHDLGILILAAQLRLKGFKVIYLGTSVPWKELAHFMRHYGQRLGGGSRLIACVSSSCSFNYEGQFRDFRQLPYPVFVGGSSAARFRSWAIPESFQLLESRGLAAVDELVHFLGQERRPR